jgi:hypothetical protein
MTSKTMKTMLGVGLLALGAIAGIDNAGSIVRRAAWVRDQYGNQWAKRNRRKPGVRKQRDKNKAARKSRVQNKGR